MKRVVTTVLISLVTLLSAHTQTIKSPGEFLGYEPGTMFTFHHDAVAYVKHVAANSPAVVYESYGRSYEGRELGVAYISSPANIAKLEELRRNNLSKAGFADYEFTGEQLPFVWLSYNLHGNESVGMEAALLTLYTLATSGYEGVEEWLERCVIILDPCLNPDGRDRYAFIYRMMQPSEPNPDPNSWERTQGWPGSRSNHYLFDLNRDWTWQTQIETRQRIALYQRFMPHVHADFHEMGSASNFFFPPGADPWHEAITEWQREFHEITGRANAYLFDKHNLLYFTKETFDLFAPSFGDTWPLFNGAMGFTYEQAGGGGAGLSIKRSAGDTLTLSDRIEGHFLASMATIKAASDNSERLVQGLNDYFSTAVNAPPFDYGSLLIRGDNEHSSLESLLELLDNNLIRYHYVASPGRRYRGFDYLEGEDREFVVKEGDIVIPASQPQGHFVKVLFEPESISTDSVSYDLSAWALPYIYNVSSYAVAESIPFRDEKVDITRSIVNETENHAYAYISEWKGFNEVRFLTSLYRNNVRVRHSTEPFTINGKDFGRGALMITRADNSHIPSLFDSLVTNAANDAGVHLHTTTTGMSESGIDFGSRNTRLVLPPRIATIGGDGVSAGAMGEIWYLFEREFNYPLTIIHSSRFAGADLSDYDVLILTSGNHTRFKDKIFEFVRGGGKVLALDRAAGLFSSESGTALARAAERRTEERRADRDRVRSDDTTLLVSYDEASRRNLPDRSSGAIYRVDLDTTHPYSYGMGNHWFIMRRSDGFPFMESPGRNIGYVKDGTPVAGFAGYRFQRRAANSLIIGSERVGRGEVIYIADNPYFRGYWKSGRLLLANILLK